MNECANDAKVEARENGVISERYSMVQESLQVLDMVVGELGSVIGPVCQSQPPEPPNETPKPLASAHSEVASKLSDINRDIRHQIDRLRVFINDCEL